MDEPERKRVQDVPEVSLFVNGQDGIFLKEKSALHLEDAIIEFAYDIGDPLSVTVRIYRPEDQDVPASVISLERDMFVTSVRERVVRGTPHLSMNADAEWFTILWTPAREDVVTVIRVDRDTALHVAKCLEDMVSDAQAQMDNVMDMDLKKLLDGDLEN
jgi:hypothetical protein